MNRISTLGLLMMAWWFPGADVFAQVSERPQISVTGTAVTCVNPDEIIWSITTTDEDPDLTKAKIASDQSAARVLAIRDRLKIAQEQLTSGRLQIERVVERVDAKRNLAPVTVFKHFRIQREFSIKQKDLDRFDEFLSEIVGGPVEGSFRYETSQRYELRNETRIKAVKLARQKAVAMAEALGVGVGEPLKITESSNGWPRNTSNFAYNQVQQRGAADQRDGQLVPDAIEIQISVQVVFALQPPEAGDK
ncbi:MAG: SIMPL domain-containing protein [Mariniblastus sp.]|nr:SIMPL domain-containing protein [Mariniblastus sp.]